MELIDLKHAHRKNSFVTYCSCFWLWFLRFFLSFSVLAATIKFILLPDKTPKKTGYPQMPLCQFLSSSISDLCCSITSWASIPVSRFILYVGPLVGMSIQSPTIMHVIMPSSSIYLCRHLNDGCQLSTLLVCVLV